PAGVRRVADEHRTVRRRFIRLARAAERPDPFHARSARRTPATAGAEERVDGAIPDGEDDQYCRPGKNLFHHGDPPGCLVSGVNPRSDLGGRGAGRCRRIDSSAVSWTSYRVTGSTWNRQAPS